MRSEDRENHTIRHFNNDSIITFNGTDTSAFKSLMSLPILIHAPCDWGKIKATPIDIFRPMLYQTLKKLQAASFLAVGNAPHAAT